MWLLGGPLLGFCVLICILCSRSVRTLRSRCATPCRLGALACANQDFLEIAHNFLEISWNFLEKHLRVPPSLFSQNLVVFCKSPPLGSDSQFPYNDGWRCGTTLLLTPPDSQTPAGGQRQRGRWPRLGFYRISHCLLYTSPSPRDKRQSRMPSSA